MSGTAVRALATPSLLLLSACGWLPLPIPAEAERAAVALERVTLAADGSTAEVRFSGAPPFDPADVCTAQYEGTGQVLDGVLEIRVSSRPHPLGAAQDGCWLVAHNRVLTIDLNVPFDGHMARDGSGRTLLVRAPPTLALLPELPPGWATYDSRYQRRTDREGWGTPLWVQTWAGAPVVPGADSREAMLSLTHAFGGHVDNRHDKREWDHEVNGNPASLSVYEPTGRMLLVWSIGDDQVALDANLASFSEAELMDLAESVVVPADAP